MNSELEVLRDVVARFEGGAIPYMLTGSVAMSVYAEPRMTRDIDIVVELAADDALRVVELRDVRKLLASGADEAYLDQWSARLGVDTLLRKCRDAGYEP